MKRFDYVQMVKSLASICIMAAILSGCLGHAKADKLGETYSELAKDNQRRVNGGWLPKAQRFERTKFEQAEPVRGERTEEQERLWRAYEGFIGPRAEERSSINVYAGLASAETTGSRRSNQEAAGKVTTTDLPYVEKNGHLNSNIVVMFSATWCGPCHRMYPIMEQLREEGYIVYVYTLDTAEFKRLKLGAKFRILAYPTFLFFDKGKEVKRSVGGSRIEWFRKNLKTKKEQEADQDDDPYDGI